MCFVSFWQIFLIFWHFLNKIKFCHLFLNINYREPNRWLKCCKSLFTIQLSVLFFECFSKLCIDGAYRTDNFRRHSSQPSQIDNRSSSIQSLSSAEEVLRSLSYQHHLVAVTKNFYYQRYESNESRSHCQENILCQY